MKSICYEFENVNTGEVVWFAREGGEYREQNPFNEWNNHRRLYPYLRLTNLKHLVLELKDLGFYLVDVHYC